MKLGSLLNGIRRIYLLMLPMVVIHFQAYGQSCNCPPVTQCGDCLGGLISLTLRYDGPIAALVVATNGSGDILHWQLVASNGTFTVEGDLPNGKFLGNQLNLSVNLLWNNTIVTNCSTPVFVNSTFGSFTVIAAESKNGGPVCCAPGDLEIIPPIILNCPPDTQVSLGAIGCSTPVSWVPPTATDNCAAVTLTSTHNPGNPFTKGTTPVVYTATDGAGNTATCSFNVTVTDDTDPVIAGCPSNITASANASCKGTVSWIIPTASDNCSGLVTLTSSHSPGLFSVGTTQVTYTATDVAGNASTCTFNVIVNDNTGPVITGCPSNIVVSANASCNANASWTAPTAIDNCGGAVTLTSSHSPGVFSLGTTPVTYTATDLAGNTSTCTFNVIVNDNTGPVIAGCPPTITVSANASCKGSVTWTAPTATDNCAGTVTLTSSHNPGLFSLGTTLVTYTARDVAGNTSTCTFNVIVNDNTVPVITGCPSNIAVSANTSCKANVTWSAPTATDNCTGTVTLTSSHTPGLFSLGTTLVTYTAKDVAGNISTCTFNVTVNDITAPVIAGCPSNITASADASCRGNIAWTAPTATDNCGGPITLASSHNPGFFSLGTTQITYTATDVAGNISTCTFNVIVNDNTAPVITGCANVLAIAGTSCEATVNWVAPGVTDCGTTTLTSSHNPGVFPLGTTEITYTATDNRGNSSTCSFNVIVEDKTSPVFQNCNTEIVRKADQTCQAAVSWEPPIALDNCEEVIVTSTHHPGDIFPLGKTEVKYTATDGKGNVSVCQFNVVVKNENLPTISDCPNDIKVKGNEFGAANVDWIKPKATAFCGEVSLVSSHQPGDLFHAGTTKVEYKATDNSGNVSYCTFNVIVSWEEIEIVIGKVVTPDGNGVNDEWTISNIEKFKDNNVIIVDRWGSVIFTASGYNNESVVWTGANRNGAISPTGTYFYTIAIKHGPGVVKKSGFIELIR